MTRTLAITGSEGFVGRAMVARAVDAGTFRVIRVVRPGTRIATVAGTEVVVADLVDGWPRGLPDVDDLVHLAWERLDDFRSIAHLEQVNRHTTFLTDALAAGVTRVIGIGTCLEYGMTEGEIHEDSDVAPILPYARGKVIVGDHLLAEADRRGLQALWARVFYPYGPGQSDRSLWSSIQRAIASGQELIDMSPGDQERDFLPVEAVGEMLTGLLYSRAWGQLPVNLCSGKPKRVRDLAAEWIAAAESPLRMNLGALPYPDYEPFSFWGHQGRLNALLGSRSDSRSAAAPSPAVKPGQR